MLKSIELFAGAGGLALAVERAGFDPVALVEWDHNSCQTLRLNGANRKSGNWRVIEGDVRSVSYRDFGDVDFVTGGPPCQPFSIGGKHQGHDDGRNMFPEAVRAIQELRPRAFVFENVKGLLRQSFSRYFEYIILQLAYPELRRRRAEEWPEHQARLERHHTKGGGNDLEYNVVFQCLNAADYGAPQKRERVFIVGWRSDLGQEWSFPPPTHSREALIMEQWITQDYWERHRVAKKTRPVPPSDLALHNVLSASALLRQPWRTVRDAISDLPNPVSGRSRQVANHVFVPGARVYVGHTGSPLDEPAKTLKAGDHGVPGGENMLVKPDGSVRYFTVREAARLQTFPDDYLIYGAWTESMRQLGNAVAVSCGEAVVRNVKEALLSARSASAA